MFEQNPKTLGRTTSSWTHRLSFGELLTFQKAKLLLQGDTFDQIWSFHFLHQVTGWQYQHVSKMSWFCRFLFVVFTMSREPLLTKFSCVDAPPSKNSPKKQEEVSDKKPFPRDRLPAVCLVTNSLNDSHSGFKSCRWNFRKEQIYSLESDIYTWAWGQNNFPRAGEVAIVGTNFKRQHWSCKFYTGKLSTPSHRCNWEKGIVVTEF